MLFNSYEFIFAFLPITFFVYFYLKSKRLITASKAFLVFDNVGSYFKHFYGKKVIDDLFSKEKEISGLLTIKNFYKYRTDITVWLNKKKEEFDKKAINE